MKAMILAAGRGTRLGDLTTATPKPMLDVAGRPILEHIVRHLARHGFRDLVINLHHHGDAIRRHFEDGSKWNVSIRYSHEDVLLGTAGAVKNVETFFTEDDFLVHYGDVVTDEDFTTMLQFHRAHDGLATLLVHQRANSNSVLELDAAHRITGFLERPAAAERVGIASTWVHSGICIARRRLLDFIPAGRPADLPRDVYVPLVSANAPLFAWPLTGSRFAVDSPERLDALRGAVRDGIMKTALS